MIKGEQKSLDEIWRMIADYKKVLLLGCGTCVTICFAGGEKEVAALASTLRLKDRKEGAGKLFLEQTVRRQCEQEFINDAVPQIKEADAILSLACSIGAQAVAERFPAIPVLPGINTTFLGLIQEPGVWSEVCVACGDCIIHLTGGLCPISRCAKSLFNGPCGGSVGGKCETSPEVPCVWQQIYDRLAAQGRLHLLEEVQPPRNWVSNSASGPRKIVREDIKIVPREPAIKKT